ncbi:MAG: class I SAM-dependent methyltransferase [Candidatus Dormibacteraceae bacterium]
MILAHVPDLGQARVLDDGCGIGTYIGRLAEAGAAPFGIDFELERVKEAGRNVGRRVACAASERLPFGDGAFEVVLSNEVIEHVEDDRAAVAEIARVLRPGGRAVIFCPNRWYPVEQHGVYWRGRYHFGNVPLVNYLPNPLRDRLAPHVRTYTRRRLLRLLEGLPLEVVYGTRIFGGYDNLIARFGGAGRLLRAGLQGAERSPVRVLGLSHLVVLERTQPVPAKRGER